MIRTSHLAVAMLAVLLVSGDARAQRPQIVLDRDGGTNRRITRLHWNNATGRLSHEGFQAWTGPDSGILEMIGR